MKVKLDENVTVAAGALLSGQGHDVDAVPSEGLTGAADVVVMRACRSDDRMLVAFDVGFGDIRAYPPDSHPGIVLLRITDQRPDSTFDVLRRFLAQHSLDDLAGTLAVVSDARIRRTAFRTATDLPVALSATGRGSARRPRSGTVASSERQRTTADEVHPFAHVSKSSVPSVGTRAVLFMAMLGVR